MAAADCHSRPRVPPRIELTSFTGLGAEIYMQTRSLIHCKRPPSDMKNSASAFLAFIALTGLRPRVLFFPSLPNQQIVSMKVLPWCPFQC